MLTPTCSIDEFASETRKLPSRPCGLPTRPTWIQPRSGAAPVKPPVSIDDVDEDAMAMLHRRSLDHGAQRRGRPTAPADHASVVVLGDGQLEDDASVVLAHFLDLDSIRIVHEPSS